MTRSIARFLSPPLRNVLHSLSQDGEDAQGIQLLPLSHAPHIRLEGDEGDSEKDAYWTWREARRAPRTGDKMKFGYVLHRRIQ